MSTPIKLSVKIPFPVVLPGDRIATIRRAQDEPDAAKRVAGVGLGPLAKALQFFDAPVAVSYYSTATPGYAAGRTTLLGLLTAEMLLHTVVVVEFGLAGEYGQAWELVYDGTGTINALREYGGPLLPVRWARTSSSAAGVPAYPERGPAYVWKVGELTRAYVTGTVAELFFKARAATALPAPSSATTDANWERVAGAAAGDLFRSVTLAEAVALLDLGTLVPGLLYAIAFPALAAQVAQTVWLQALDVYTFQGVGHVYADGTNERSKLVTSNVRTGAVADFSSGGRWTQSLTAPVSPTTGDKWLLTSSGQIFEYYADADTSQWFEIAGTIAGTVTGTSTTTTESVKATYTAKTAAYSVAAATDYCIHCTAGSFTVTLPTAVGIAGQQFIIKNSGAGTITIATTSSQTIDGQPTAILATQYGSISVMSTGASYIIN